MAVRASSLKNNRANIPPPPHTLCLYIVHGMNTGTAAYIDSHQSARADALGICISVESLSARNMCIKKTGIRGKTCFIYLFSPHFLFCCCGFIASASPPRRRLESIADKICGKIFSKKSTGRRNRKMEIDAVRRPVMHETGNK